MKRELEAYGTAASDDGLTAGIGMIKMGIDELLPGWLLQFSKAEVFIATIGPQSPENAFVFGPEGDRNYLVVFTRRDLADQCIREMPPLDTAMGILGIKLLELAKRTDRGIWLNPLSEAFSVKFPASAIPKLLGAAQQMLKSGHGAASESPPLPVETPAHLRRDPIKETLDANLDGDFSIFACGPNTPQEEVLRAFETQLGYSLPDDFRKFSMSPYGGMYIEVKESIWPKAKLNDIGPFWGFLRGVMTYGFSSDIPEHLDIRKQTLDFQQRSGLKYVPFLKIIGDPKVYCFDERGAVRQWDHGTGQAPLVGKSFTVLFAEEVAALKQRKERKKSETGNAPKRA